MIEESFKLEDTKYFEGCLGVKPRIYCPQHEQVVTHGCAYTSCETPLYCGHCYEHPHSTIGPYASLQGIEQYLFEISQRVRKVQLPMKQIRNQLVSNKENQSLLQWQEDLEEHLKQIDNFILAQKEIINSDVEDIKKKLVDVVDINKIQVLRRLDDFQQNYRSQFMEFKQYNEEIFQLLERKYRYLSDPNSLCAKLVSLDPSSSTIFLSELRETLSNCENLLSQQQEDLSLSRIEQIFEKMNSIVNQVPNYKPLSEFDLNSVVQNNQIGGSNLIRSSQQNNRIKLVEDIKVSLESHFKDACSNFGETFKLGIPPNLISRKKKSLLNANPSKTITTIQKSPSLNYPDQNNYSTQGINYMKSYSNQNYNNFVGSSKNLPPSNLPANQMPLQQRVISDFSAVSQQQVIYSNEPYQRAASPLNKTSTAPRQKIFGNKDQLSSSVLSNTRNAQGTQQTQANLSTSSSPFSSIGGNTGNLNKPLLSTSNNIMQQQSKHLKFKKEFKFVESPLQFPSYICYLGQGYIAMAGNPGDKLQVLDTNTQNIIFYKSPITRPITFLASINSTQNGGSQILNFAMSNVDSVILLFSVNIAQKEIFQQNVNIVGFAAPITRIADLFSITGKTIFACGDERGDISVLDYQSTKGYDLPQIHQSELIQLLSIPQYSQGTSSNDHPKFVSLGYDQVFVIYEFQKSDQMFSAWKTFNVSNIGGGICTLRPHPELESLLAVCEGGSLKSLRWDSKDLQFSEIHPQKAKDIAVFSMLDFKGNKNDSFSFLPQSDPQMSGLIFLSEMDSDKLLLFKTSYQSNFIKPENFFSNTLSSRKLLYTDNKSKQLIIINDSTQIIQIYEILL